jgi:hypothetical protein
VFLGIAAHLRRASTRGEEGFDQAENDEDTITGDFLSSLRTNWKSGDGAWRWRVTYKKFKGRGRGAEEKELGADGIVQVEFDDRHRGRVVNKGLFFQAKKVGNRGRQELLEQVRKMERLVPSGCAVFEYGPAEYRAFDGSHVIEHDGRLRSIQTETNNQIGDYLADRFLPCETGVRGCFFEAHSRTLVFPDATNGVQRLKAKLKHRLKIEVRRS